MVKESEYNPEARAFVTEHVKRHVEEGMDQERAVAAAMDEARRKGLKVPGKQG